MDLRKAWGKLSIWPGWRTWKRASCSSFWSRRSVALVFGPCMCHSFSFLNFSLLLCSLWVYPVLTSHPVSLIVACFPPTHLPVQEVMFPCMLYASSWILCPIFHMWGCIRLCARFPIALSTGRGIQYTPLHNRMNDWHEDVDAEPTQQQMGIASHHQVHEMRCYWPWSQADLAAFPVLLSISLKLQLHFKFLQCLGDFFKCFTSNVLCILPHVLKPTYNLGNI